MLYFFILAQNEEIIVEKRQRKSIVQQDFDTAEYDESDAHVSENDDLISDFTDSEVEWGVMNQRKNIVKQPLQTSSKLLELEKQLSEKEKMLKYDFNNLLDTNQNDEYSRNDKTLVDLKNEDDISLLEVKDSKSIAQGNIYFNLVIIISLIL